MATIMHETTLTTMECGCCGGVYAISESYRSQCQKLGDNANGWKCPYCGESWGYHESEADRLRRQLSSEQQKTIIERQRHDQTRAELRETENRRRAEKAAKTRIKNRVSKGVCPCCNRHFENLQRHMQGQHPDYASKGD